MKALRYVNGATWVEVALIYHSAFPAGLMPGMRELKHVHHCQNGQTKSQNLTFLWVAGSCQLNKSLLKLKFNLVKVCFTWEKTAFSAQLDFLLQCQELPPNNRSAGVVPYPIVFIHIWAIGAKQLILCDIMTGSCPNF